MKKSQEDPSFGIYLGELKGEKKKKKKRKNWTSCAPHWVLKHHYETSNQILFQHLIFLFLPFLVNRMAYHNQDGPYYRISKEESDSNSLGGRSKGEKSKTVKIEI